MFISWKQGHFPTWTQYNHQKSGNFSITIIPPSNPHTPFKFHLLFQLYSLEVQDPVENHVLQLVFMSLKSPSVWNSSLGFSCILWPWHIWEVWASYFVECPSLRLVWDFFLIKFRLWILSRNITEMIVLLFSVYNTKRYTVLRFTITGDAHFDYLIKVISAKLFFCKSILYLLKNN